MKRLPIALLVGAILGAAVGSVLVGRPVDEGARGAPLAGGALLGGAPNTALARASSESGEPARQWAKRAGIDLNSVVETVRHRVARSQCARLVSEDCLYRAEFSSSGFALALRKSGPKREFAEKSAAGRSSLRTKRAAAPVSVAAETIPFETGPGFRIDLSGVRLGGEGLRLTAGAWRSEDNSALRQVLAGLTEPVTARESELDWDFVLARRPSGAGDLRIDARVSAAWSSQARRQRAGAAVELAGRRGTHREDGRARREGRSRASKALCCVVRVRV